MEHTSDPQSTPSIRMLSKHKSGSKMFKQHYGTLKKTHDEAYKTIEEAICLEEQERPNDAVEKYKQGIAVIDNALNIQISSVDDDEDLHNKWNEACKMVQKMKKTRAEVLTRINSITTGPNYTAMNPPPSYDEAMTSSSSSSGSSTRIRNYNELAEALDNLQVDTAPNGRTAQLLYSHDNVQLYFISPDGVVLSTSERQTLNISIIDGNEDIPSTTFLQIGNWVYPLVAGVSPCYRTDYGAFILPDVHSDVPGSAVGLIISDDKDGGTLLEILENILHGVVSQKEPLVEERSNRARRTTPTDGYSGPISRGILTGASYISKGLVFGAQKAGDLINYSTPKLMNKMTPAAEAVAVNQNLKTGINIAKNVTNGAVGLTGFVADKVGVATAKLGHFLAPHVQKQGTRLLSSSFKISEEEASDKMSGVLTVAAGAVEGFATVYKGLETSASILGENLKDNSVKIVEYKYGAPAGEVACETLNTVGNVVIIGHNAKIFNPKGMAKFTAKATGKAIVRDLHSDQAIATDTEATQSNYLYPSLPNNTSSLEKN